MIDIKINEELKEFCPNLTLGIITANVHVEDSSKELLEDIDNELEKYINLSLEDVLVLDGIKESRYSYKSLGKDPSRYRLSSESLLRRIVKGKDLYRVNNIVDICNLVSIISKNSVGIYDLDKVKGNIEFKIGKADPYEGIGRGIINIENMPVLYDCLGPFGSSTSDSIRTMVTSNTKNILMNIISFQGETKLKEYIEYSVALLTKYGYGKNIHPYIIN